MLSGRWALGTSLIRCARAASRAAFLRRPGKPLEVERLETPGAPLRPEQVAIGVQYCSLNSNDVKYLERSDDRSLPRVPGYELSGEIVEVGSGDLDFTPGQRVVAIAPERCGGLATRVSLEAEDVWLLPSEVSTCDAAALVYGHSTALLAFTEKRPIDEHDTVLIIAGAGGFGLAAVDVAAGLFKAKIIAICDTEGKASLLRDRGAYAAFKNDPKHNLKEIADATEGGGVDLIYDAVGGPILNTVIDCLKDKENGAVLTTYKLEELNILCKENGDQDDDEKKVKKGECEISKEILKRVQTVSLAECRWENREKYRSIVEQVLSFCEDGAIGAHVSKTFDLEEVNEAIEYVKGKMCTGKVLIRVEDKDED